MQLKVGIDHLQGAHSSIRLDPHCSKGILNTEMTHCCQADCGECHDGSDICKASATNGRGTTCCPSQMPADLVSCELSLAPCAVPVAVRNPPTLDSIASADRHAKSDCNEVVPKTQATNHLSTAYIKFAGKTTSKTSATETDCDEYGTFEQAAAACSKSDDCMGFTASDEGPKCLLVAGTALEDLSDSTDSVYLKREDGYAGHTFRFGESKFDQCTKTCGGGTQVATMACESDAGVSKKLGLCSLLVAMNADILPSSSAPCNVAPCEEMEAVAEPGPESEGACSGEIDGCIDGLHPLTYYYGNIGTSIFTLCPSTGWAKWCPDCGEYRLGNAVDVGPDYIEYGPDDRDWVPTDSPLKIKIECLEDATATPTIHMHPQYYYDDTGFHFKFDPVASHPCACAKKK